MDKLKMHSVNKVDENVERIGRLFPNCVTETIVDDKLTKVIDFEMLKQELSSVVVEGRDERYQFTWPDKKKSILLANAPIAKTLRPCLDESVDFDTTENLYIEGDNLDVLKLLQETYLGKVKMIYIDPPYNTGRDAFVYNDVFSMQMKSFAEASGQRDEDGNVLFDFRPNNEANGRFHTDWLNMMYTRLKLAKDLLSDEGIIFISIDDNEVDNLKKICTEIFGESNFIGCAGRITKKSNNKGDFWAPNFDYILTCMRLCVDKEGNRMDAETCGATVHSINMLTVIASESYAPFVSDLQKQIKDVLYDRPSKATMDYFVGKTVKIGEQPTTIDTKQAKDIYRYLLKHDYVDDDDNVTDAYRTDLANNALAPLPEDLQPIADGVHTLIQGVFDERVLNDMIENGNKTKIFENELNDNFYKKEFQTLWGYINHKYAYTVEFDTNELIEKAIKHIDESLFVSQLQYTVSTGEQKTDMEATAVERGDAFKAAKTQTQTLRHAEISQVKYDLIGKVAEGTTLTRRTTAAILSGLNPVKLAMFRQNPEEFITKVIRLIKEQKATMIVEHIYYDRIEGEYDSTIFTAEKHSQSIDKAFRADKHIQDYVFTDGTAEQSVERRFAQDLDGAKEVCVYAKLPKGFQIPTPVGNYSPDWAIAFYEGTVKHIYFVAETKGTMESLSLRPIEKAKISCARKLFNEISTENVVYHDVDCYQSLLNIMNSL